MEPLKIATVQFETRDNDKVYNLSDSPQTHLIFLVY